MFEPSGQQKAWLRPLTPKTSEGIQVKINDLGITRAPYETIRYPYYY